MNKNTFGQPAVSRGFLLTAGGLVLLTLLVYLQVRGNDFITFDDRQYVTQNPHIKGLNLDNTVWAFTTYHMGNWHPLTWLSLMLDYELYGLNAGGFHITNLIFHIANAVLLFWLFLRMTKLLWPSAFVAALFALHPLHVESVAWVAERKDVLSTFFWFLTMLAYLRYTENRTKLRYLAIVLFFILGLMAKPMLVTLPFVLLLIDYWPLERLGKVAIIEKLPLFAISVCSSVVTFFAQRSGGAVATVDVLPLWMRFSNAVVAYMQYIDKMIRPVGFALVYPHPRENIKISHVVIAAVLLIVVSIAVVLLRKRRWLVTGWLWYIGTLVPVIGIIQVGVQGMADRYMYIPMIGLSIMIAWEVRQASLRFHIEHLIKILAVIVIAILSFLTWRQAGFWRDNMTLYKHTLAVTRDNFTIENNMGLELLALGKNDEAIKYFREAVRIRPLFEGAHNNLGVAYKRTGDSEQAIRCFREAIKANPYYADAYVAMAELLEKQGKTDEAVENYTKALRLNNNNAKAHFLLGKILAGRKDVQQAIAHYEQVIRFHPDLADVKVERDKLADIMKKAGTYYEQAKTLEKQGNIADAVKNYRQALDLVGDSPAGLNNLAWLLATNPKALNPAEAVGLAEQAATLTGYNQPGILDTLAAAYAANGDFAKAVETAQKAVDSAKSSQLAESITIRLELYKKGTAYIEPAE